MSHDVDVDVEGSSHFAWPIVARSRRKKLSAPYLHKVFSDSGLQMSPFESATAPLQLLRISNARAKKDRPDSIARLVV